MKFFSLEMSDMVARDVVMYSVGGYDYTFDTKTGNSAWLINSDGLKEQSRQNFKATIPTANIPSKL